jgi:uncharacterized protein (DUF58 family)
VSTTNTHNLRATIRERSYELRRITLRTKRTLNTELIGNYRSSFRGSGLNFSELREYAPGDDIKHIDWRSSARSGKTYVKSFEEERQLTVILAVDASASTNSGFRESILHRALGFSSLIATLAAINQDLCGLVLFSDKVISELKPSNRRTQVDRILNELNQADPSGRTDINIPLTHILSHFRKKSILFILSDFYSESFETRLKQAALHHDIILVAPELDILDTLPERGIVEYSDPETGEKRLIDAASKKSRLQLKSSLQKREIELTELARRNKAQLIFLGKDPLRPLISLMERRKKLGA